MKYVVTNVRLEAPLLRSIKQRALERGVPASVIIREAVQEYLAAPEIAKADWDKARADLLKLCGLGRSRDAGRGSVDVDGVLYGPRPPRRRR